MSEAPHPDPEHRRFGPGQGGRGGPGRRVDGGLFSWREGRPLRSTATESRRQGRQGREVEQRQKSFGQECQGQQGRKWKTLGHRQRQVRRHGRFGGAAPGAVAAARRSGSRLGVLARLQTRGGFATFRRCKLPDIHEVIEAEAQEWEAVKNLPNRTPEEVAAEADDTDLHTWGHPWGCGEQDARFQKLMEAVFARLHCEEMEGGDHNASLKLKPLEGSEAFAPGYATENAYADAARAAPSQGVVCDLALLKSRSREAHLSAYRLTFSNDTWGSFLMGFLLNLEATEAGAAKGWRLQRWRKKRPFF